MTSGDYLGEDFIPDYRPDVWKGAEGRAIRDLMIDNGFGDTVRAVDALQDVDASALARIALTVYGTSDAFSSGDVADRADIPAGDVNSAQDELGAIATELDRDYGRNVVQHWQGDARDAYSGYMEKLARATRDEAKRLAELGDELLNLARTIQRTQLEQEMTAWSSGATALSAAGLIGANPVGLGLSAAGSFLTLSQFLYDANEAGAARAEQTTEYAIALEKPKLVRTEIADLELPDIDAAEWEAK